MRSEVEVWNPARARVGFDRNERHSPSLDGSAEQGEAGCRSPSRMPRGSGSESRVSPSGHHPTISSREDERPAAHDVRRAVLNEDPAATYSPRQLPTKYHRRYAA